MTNIVNILMDVTLKKSVSKVLIGRQITNLWHSRKEVFGIVTTLMVELFFESSPL